MAFGMSPFPLRFGSRQGGETAIYLATESYSEMPPGNPDETDFSWTPDFDIYPSRTTADHSNHVTGTAYYVDPNGPDAGEARLASFTVTERTPLDSDDFTSYADTTALFNAAKFSDGSFGTGTAALDGAGDRVELVRVDVSNQGILSLTVPTTIGKTYVIGWSHTGTAIRTFVSGPGYDTTGLRSITATGTSTVVQFTPNGNGTGYLTSYFVQEVNAIESSDFTGYADTAALLADGFTDDSAGTSAVVLDADEDEVVFTRDTSANNTALEITVPTTADRIYGLTFSASGAVTMLASMTGISASDGVLSSATTREATATGESITVRWEGGHNPGTGSEGDPFKTMLQALNTANPRIIYAKPGRYYGDWPTDSRLDGTNPTTDGVRLALMPWPGESGRVQLIAATDPDDVSWTDNEDGTYTATLANAFSGADMATLDAKGMPTPLTVRASSEALGSAEEGVYISGTTVMVKPHREGAPDSDLVVFRVLNSLSTLYSYRQRQIYLRGVDAFGISLGISGAADSGGPGFTKIDGCRFGYTPDAVDALSFASISFDATFYVRNSTISYAGADGISVEQAESTDCLLLEERLTIDNAGWLGALDAANQCSTGHDGATTITVNCDYSNAGGQVVADTTGAMRWVINSRLGPTRSTGSSRDVDGISSTVGSIVWADTVTITGGHKSFQGADETSKIYTRDVTADGSGSASGTY